MKKVLIVYGGAKHRGGIYTYLEGIFFGSKNDPEVELSLATIGNWPLGTSLEKNGFEVWVADKNPGGLLSGIKKSREFDAIVTMGLVSNFFGRFWAFWAHKPLLTVVHSDWRTDYLSSPIKKFIFAVAERLMRFVTKRYITVSEYLKGRLMAEGVKQEKISVIYNGVTQPEELRGKKYGVSEGKGEENAVFLNKSHNSYSISHTPGTVVIGSVGRLHPVKNYQELILAIADLKKQGQNVRLEIAGDGAEKEKLEKVIRENGLSKEVRLLGWRKDLNKLRQGWDIYIQPSITEGFGLAAVEAMQQGLPVVVTPGGALPELVADGETGIVATGFGHTDIAQALEKMISDREKMAKMAEAGQKFAAENFGIDKWTQETLKEYAKVAK